MSEGFLSRGFRGRRQKSDLSGVEITALIGGRWETGTRCAGIPVPHMAQST